MTKSARGGRIAKTGPRRAPLHGATLQAPRRLASEACINRHSAIRIGGDNTTSSVAPRTVTSARAQRTELPEDQVTVGNVRTASTVSLLRVRARYARAKYVRLWRCYANNKVEPFKIDMATIEGEDGEEERIANLLDYIGAHAQESDYLERRIRVNEDASKRLRKANRGGGSLLRMMKERDEAVIDELDLRKANGELSPAIAHYVEAPEDAEADKERSNAIDGTLGAGPSGQELSSTHTLTESATANVDNSTAAAGECELYSASYADDVRRINRQLDAEEAGVKKPNRNDRLVAVRVSAYQRGDMAIVQSLDAQAQRRRDAKKRARARKKVRKAAVNANIKENFGPRDPNSDNE